MRATSPVIGAVLVVGITVALATLVGATVLALPGPPDPAARVVLSATASPDGTIALTLEAGETLDVRGLDLVIAVDGEPLAHQPPIPFFSAAGFAPGPTGPFNSAADPTWSAGERASLRVAGTNEPTIVAGATVRVRVVVGDYTVADLEATAR